MTLHAPSSLPIFLQRGRAETRVLALRNEQGGKLPCTGGAYTLLDSEGDTVETGELEVNAGVPSYALPSDFASEHSLPQAPWRERWALTGIAGEASDTATVELEVMVCRVAPVRHVDLEQLYRMHPQWRAWIPRAQPAGSVGAYLELAWEELLARLLGDGVLPHRTLNWWALSVVHRYWAASLTARDFATDNPTESRFADLADRYWERCQDELDHHVGLQKDSDEDGVADNPGVLESNEPQLFLTDLPATGYEP